jgi:hypothetical protein
MPRAQLPARVFQGAELAIDRREFGTRAGRHAFDDDEGLLVKRPGFGKSRERFVTGRKQRERSRRVECVAAEGALRFGNRSAKYGLRLTVARVLHQGFTARRERAG